jgi:hypothetical protein
MDLINNTLSGAENDLLLKMTANVNFKETITAISGGISLVSEVEPIMDEQDFPIITLAISSKQNISASVVPSESMNPSLYLRKKRRNNRVNR